MENDFFVDIECEAFEKGKSDGIADAASEIENDCEYLGKLKGYKYGLVLGIIQESCESFIESNNNSTISSKKLEAYRQILDLTRNIPLKNDQNVDFDIEIGKIILMFRKLNPVSSLFYINKDSIEW